MIMKKIYTQFSSLLNYVRDNEVNAENIFYLSILIILVEMLSLEKNWYKSQS